MELRKKLVCTSVTLQLDVAKNLRVKMSDSAVRKVLAQYGYQWRPRSKNRKYDKEQRALRLAFARPVVRMSAALLREKLSLSLDGAIVPVPPEDETERYNFCKFGDTHVYRKASEGLDPHLAGHDAYAKQLPMKRALPIWGGCSAGGFATVLWHKNKKCSVGEWEKAVKNGILTRAIKSLRPVKPNGPWHIVCDNEHFLTSKAVKKAHKKAKINLW